MTYPLLKYIRSLINYYASRVSLSCFNLLALLAAINIDIEVYNITQITNHVNTSSGNDLTKYAAINTPTTADKLNTKAAFLG